LEGDTMKQNIKNLIVSLLLGFFIVLFANISNAELIKTITWIAPTTNADGSPLNDLAGYRLYYSRTSGQYTGDNDEINMPLATSYTVTIPNANPGDTFYFRMTAFDTSNNESEPSNEISYTIPIPDTTAPSKFIIQFSQ